jgi:hypothetical protein
MIWPLAIRGDPEQRSKGNRAAKGRNPTAGRLLPIRPGITPVTFMLVAKRFTHAITREEHPELDKRLLGTL